MPILETDFYLLELPEEWEAEQEEETVVITDDDEVSTIEITSMCKQGGAVGPDDLLEFNEELTADGIVGKPAQLGEFVGEYYEYEDDGAWWREWLVYRDDVLLLVTHGVELDNRGLDDATVDDILSTLLILKHEEDEA